MTAITQLARLSRPCVVASPEDFRQVQPASCAQVVWPAGAILPPVHTRSPIPLSPQKMDPKLPVALMTEDRFLTQAGLQGFGKKNSLVCGAMARQITGAPCSRCREPHRAVTQPGVRGQSYHKLASSRFAISTYAKTVFLKSVDLAAIPLPEFLRTVVPLSLTTGWARHGSTAMGRNRSCRLPDHGVLRVPIYIPYLSGLKGLP